MTGVLDAIFFIASPFWHVKTLRTDIPKFGEPIQNQTIAVGREAVFSCVVDNLQTYKVSFPFKNLIMQRNCKNSGRKHNFGFMNNIIS